MRVPSLILALACLASPALAWNDLGHMTVASIAYKHLNPAVKAECDRLLALGDDPKARDFVSAAPWADDVRKDRKETGPWHYLDHYFRPDGSAANVEAAPENVVTAIETMEATLRDHTKTDAQRSEALKFLIHFVGDSHQPLHCSSRVTDALPAGDKGGNDFKILPPEGLVPQPKNLHSLWDQGCGLFAGRRLQRPLTASGAQEVEQFAAQLQDNYAKDLVEKSKVLSPEKWTLEGLDLSKSDVYNLTEGTTPSESYLNSGRKLAGQRVVLAGLRLAALLNKDLN